MDELQEGIAQICLYRTAKGGKKSSTTSFTVNQSQSRNDNQNAENQHPQRSRVNQTSSCDDGGLATPSESASQALAEGTTNHLPSVKRLRDSNFAKNWLTDTSPVKKPFPFLNLNPQSGFHNNQCHPAPVIRIQHPAATAPTAATSLHSNTSGTTNHLPSVKRLRDSNFAKNWLTDTSPVKKPFPFRNLNPQSGFHNNQCHPAPVIRIQHPAATAPAATLTTAAAVTAATALHSNTSRTPENDLSNRLLIMSDHNVTVGETENAEKIMKKHIAIEKASLRIYKIIDPMILNDEKVVLFEIFGIGNLMEEESIIQVQVALSLLQRLEKKNGKVRVTSREPEHNDAEKEYLEKNLIEVREVGFTTEDYLEASKGTPNPILICCMIHGMPQMYEDFIATHYNHINQVIFIGNEPKWIRKYKGFKNLEMINKVFASTDPKPLDKIYTFIPKHTFATTFIYRSNI